MPCHAPKAAWRTLKGTILRFSTPTFKELTRSDNPYTYIEVPCTKCEGCQQAHARAWAFRCQLELQQHQHTVFTTLTYAPENEPITLAKRHIQLWIKRLRKKRELRYFISGEYGENTQRPHYHAILFGISTEQAEEIEKSWGLGHCRTYPANAKTIAYTAGYTAKKNGWNLQAKQERINPETGEVYTWQPPFIEMSRGGKNGHGIGGHARKWPESWRLYAIDNGTEIPVPRYLHESWRQQATPEQILQLREEKIQIIKQKQPETLKRYQQQQEARIRNAQAKHKEQQQKRAI